MSIEVMTYVWKNSPSKSGRLLVLLALADRAHDNGICWPGVNELAKKARLGPRQVERALKELEADGEIERPKGRPSERFPYRIRQDDGPSPTTGSSSPMTGSSVAGVGTPIQEPSVDPSKEPSVDNRDEVKAKVEAYEQSIEEEVQDVWATYLKATGKKPKLDDKRRKHITNALKVAQGDDQPARLKKCKLAVVGLTRSPHHRGENDTGTQYLDIRYALKGIKDESDEERIEKMAALAAQPGPAASVAGIDPTRIERRLEAVQRNRSSGGYFEPGRAVQAQRDLEEWGFTLIELDRAPWVRLQVATGDAETPSGPSGGAGAREAA
jgi:hypothetical protein